MKQKVINFLLIVMLLASCSGNRMYDSLMQRADSIMDLDDDSAKVAIQMLDGVKLHLSDFTKGQRMRYELLYHKAMNKAYISFKSDSIMLEVADYYEHHGSDNDRMLAYYVLGCVYRDMHEAPTALECYHRAIEQADTMARNCDYATLSRVYSQMGVLFEKQYLIYEELDAYEKASKYAFRAGDSLNAIRFYQNRMGAFAIVGKIDSAINVNLNAAKMFKRIGNDYEAAIAFGCNNGFYLQKGDARKAQEAFNAYISTGYEGNLEYEDSKAYILNERGLYYMYMNQFDSAFSYLKQSLHLSKSYGNKAATTKALAQYYSKTNRPNLAIQFALKSLEYEDSDFIDTRNSQLQQMQAMYDYSRNQEKARKAEQEAELGMRMLYIVIMGSLALLIVLTIIYRRRLNFKKKRIAAARILYEDSLLKLRKLQEDLAHLIAENGKEQSAHIREKEEEIERLKREMEEVRKKDSNPLLSDTDIILRNSSVYKKIRYVEMHPRETLQEVDWNDLADTIERLIPSFVLILKDQICPKDYKICLLVRMGVSSSSIANLVGLSASGVSAARRRMLKKLCQKEGNPKEFDRFIRQIK